MMGRKGTRKNLKRGQEFGENAKSKLSKKTDEICELSVKLAEREKEIAALKMEVTKARSVLERTNTFRVSMFKGGAFLPPKEKKGFAAVIKSAFGVECNFDLIEDNTLFIFYQSRAGSSSETIVGVCTLAWNEKPGKGLLANFALHRQHQGIGLARIFLDTILASTPAGKTYLQLTHVVTEDRTLIKVLKSLDFTDTKDRGTFKSGFDPREFEDNDGERVFLCRPTVAHDGARPGSPSF